MNMMRKIYALAILMVVAITVSAQTTGYEQRYNLLVSKLGPAGVGVETVLDNWAKTDSTNIKLLTARFDYYFNKAQTAEVVKKSNSRYLGMKPLLTLKDSTGADVYYYQESFFNDEIYGQAIKAADKAIAFHPDNLDFRFMKANAYISYEKESPDMALAYLLDLASEGASGRHQWTFQSAKADEGFFEEAMQEYCFAFYSIGSKEAMQAFLSLSQVMHDLYPDNPGFLNNIGSYHMVSGQNYKEALKCYTKVLKKHPDDYTAIKNSMLAARKMKSVKLEKKYLQMVMKYGPESERKQAEIRLKSIGKK